MKETPLTQIHLESGAKMANFAGFYMPVMYSGIKDEHLNVRSAAGIFDVSHMGEFIIKGSKALDLIQKISTNNAAKLLPGKAQYSCMCNEKGGIVDDMLVYMLEEEAFMLVVNASNIEKDWNWIKKQNVDPVEMINVSDDLALIALQGPMALSILQRLTETNLSEITYYSFTYTNLAGLDNIMISATGYTGSGGFEIYLPSGNAVHVWNSIFEADTQNILRPAGLGARDTLRLEMGYCLYGNDIDDSTLPIEAGLGWITKLSKDFIGSDIIRKAKENGLERKLVGFELLDKGIPRQGYAAVDASGEQIGEVTSGTFSPSLDKAIGMAYISIEFTKPGTEIWIQVRNRKLKAQTVQTPFYKAEN